MTSSANPPVNPSSEYQGIGVPDDSLGSVLQRGGEELKVEKLPDRFTVQLTDQTASPFSETQAAAIPIEPLGIVAPSQLQALGVAADRLDEVMELARSNDQVAFASHVYRLANSPGTLYLTNQITIQFAPSVAAATQEILTAPLGLHLVKPIDTVPNAFVYEVTGNATENPIKISNRLMRLPEVILAEPNIAVLTQSLYKPKDNLYSQQWYLNHNGGQQLESGSHISAEQAWDLTRGNRTVVVAIADDSVDLNHPDFQGVGKIVAPVDLKGNDYLPLPEGEDNHGTACAGVAVAEENGSGVVGVAPGCALMPIRTTGYLDDESVEEVFNWAIDKGASVISCSWGASAVYFPLSLRQSAALNKAATQGRKGKGCVIVFAAGNANRPINGVINESGWPQNVIKGQTKWLGGFTVHPDVITVSACTSLNQKAAYSNWGNGVSVCAPSNNAPPGMWLQETGYVNTPPAVQQSLSGLGVFTTDRLGAAGYDPGNFTPGFGGTSSATPVVAGVAALVLSMNPNLTAAEVKRILEKSTDKIVDANPDPQFGIQMGTYDGNGYSQWFGYGKVNAFKAVQAANKMKVVPQPPSRRVQATNNNSMAIPDYNPNGVTSTLYVSESSRLQDIQVTVEIEHKFLGDIEIRLSSPTGETVLLQNRTLGRQTRLQKTYTLQTTPLLERFLNRVPQGSWKLVVADLALLDTGTLKSWQLNLGV